MFLFLSYSFGIETKIRSYLPPQFPWKPYPVPDQNEQNLYPFSDQKGAKPPAKTLPDGAAHTYMAYIGKYPPSPPPEGVC